LSSKTFWNIKKFIYPLKFAISIAPAAKLALLFLNNEFYILISEFYDFSRFICIEPADENSALLLRKFEFSILMFEFN
jgi:hypothetical protein